MIRAGVDGKHYGKGVNYNPVSEIIIELMLNLVHPASIILPLY